MDEALQHLQKRKSLKPTQSNHCSLNHVARYSKEATYKLYQKTIA